jgi:Domain of unknown function (DUF6438)
VRRTSFLAVLALVSCSRHRVASSEESSTGQAAVAPAIILERTACFGRCPVYRISASSSGVVSYQGTAHVRHLGGATGQIPAERIGALLKELDDAGYFSFADRYTSSGASCGRYATDLPTVITSATLHGRTKQVEHDQGCAGAPGALVVLERRIDDVLGSGQWTGR